MDHAAAEAFVIALAVGSMGYISAYAKISRPFRDWLDRKSKNSKLFDWFADLFGCPFCVGHWITFGLVAIYQPWLVDAWLPIDFIVTSEAIVAVAMVPLYVIRKALGKA